MATPTTPRVHELAKRLGVGTKELRERANAELGIEYDGHMKRVTADEEARIVALFQPAVPEKGRLVRELARDLGLTNRVILDAVAEHHADWEVKSHGKRLTPEQDAALVALLSGGTSDAAPKKKAAPKRKAPAKKAPSKKVATSSALDTPASDEAPTAPAPKKKRAPKKKAGTTEGTEGTDDTPKSERTSKKQADEDGRRSRSRRDEPVEITIDLVEAARGYLRPILTGMGMPRVRIDGHVDGSHLDVAITGYGVEAVIGSANAAARTDVIEALEVVAHRALSNAAGTSVRVRVDVNGFRAGRRDAVRDAAARLADWVRHTGRSVQFAAMNSFDRYAFHKALNREKGISTESDGYGVFRRLGVYPRD